MFQFQDIDIKRQGATTAFGFVQYVDIVSVVNALKAMEGEHIGTNKIKVCCSFVFIGKNILIVVDFLALLGSTLLPFTARTSKVFVVSLIYCIHLIRRLRFHFKMNVYVIVIFIAGPC